MKSVANDYITGFVAASAIVYPSVNLPSISADAQLILPILGVILVIVQIYVYLRYHNKDY